MKIDIYMQMIVQKRPLSNRGRFIVVRIMKVKIFNKKIHKISQKKKYEMKSF